MAESEVTEDVASSEDSSKGIHNPINESSKTQEASEKKPTKTVKWDPDLVISKKFETSADVEPQLKKSKWSGKAESHGFLPKSQDPEAASPAPRMVRIISHSENNRSGPAAVAVWSVGPCIA